MYCGCIYFLVYSVYTEWYIKVEEFIVARKKMSDYPATYVIKSNPFFEGSDNLSVTREYVFKQERELSQKVADIARKNALGARKHQKQFLELLRLSWYIWGGNKPVSIVRKDFLAENPGRFYFKSNEERYYYSSIFSTVFMQHLKYFYREKGSWTSFLRSYIVRKAVTETFRIIMREKEEAALLEECRKLLVQTIAADDDFSTMDPYNDELLELELEAQENLK